MRSAWQSYGHNGPTMGPSWRSWEHFFFFVSAPAGKLPRRCWGAQTIMGSASPRDYNAERAPGHQPTGHGRHNGRWPHMRTAVPDDPPPCAPRVETSGLVGPRQAPTPTERLHPGVRGPAPRYWAVNPSRASLTPSRGNTACLFLGLLASCGLQMSCACYLNACPGL